jgi:hypothetical protein
MVDIIISQEKNSYMSAYQQLRDPLPLPLTPVAASPSGQRAQQGTVARYSFAEADTPSMRVTMAESAFIVYLESMKSESGLMSP